jgi:hypothetical protein
MQSTLQNSAKKCFLCDYMGEVLDTVVTNHPIPGPAELTPSSSLGSYIVEREIGLHLFLIDFGG